MSDTTIYKSVISEFSDPDIRGTFEGPGQPFLTFNRVVDQSSTPAIVQILLNYVVKGMGTSFYMEVNSKTTFEVYKADALSLQEVYNMHMSVLADLKLFLLDKIGRNGFLPIQIPVPQLQDLQDELHAFVFRYRFGPLAANQSN